MVVNWFDVICFSETWLNSTWSDNELHIDGYNIIRRVTTHKEVAALPYITARISWVGNDSIFLTLPNRKKTLICSLYKPCNADFDAFKASLDDVLDQSASEGVKTHTR